MIDNTRHDLATTAALTVAVATVLAFAATPTLAALTTTSTPATASGSPAGEAATPAASAAVDTLDSQESGRLQLSSVTVNPGETTVVRLRAEADNVAGYQTNITFDPSVIRIEGVDGTEDFGSPVANVNNEQGWVVLTQSTTEGVDDPVLARLRLSAVGSDGDTTALSFVADETSLNDAERNPLNPALVAGEVDIAAGDVTADTTTATATTAADTETATNTQQTGDSDQTTASDSQQVDSPDDGSGGGLLGNPMALAGGAAAIGGAVTGGVLLGKRL
jgi:hypothetical protein